MSQGRRWITAGLLSVQTAWLAGCLPFSYRAEGETPAKVQLGLPAQTASLAAELADPEEPRLARMQRAETPAIQLPRSQPTLPGRPQTQPASPRPSGATAPPANQPPLASSGTTSSGTKQASLVLPRGGKITVRAWVNGKPIFDDEVMQNIPQSALRPLGKMTQAQRAERLADLFNQTLDQIIEQEIVYQEAVRKLEKVNPKTLEKLKTLAEQDFEKQVERIRKSGQVPEEQVKEFQRQMRRQMERSFISMEYMRSRIFPLINQGIGFQEIKDYYDAHPNEFQTVESLKWQDVFLAVGPKYPTLADARRAANDLVAQCRTGDDFVKLLAYDDGDSKFRGGEGQGSRRGEIRPAELEAHLFKLRDGEIGPIVPLSTGVHIFRLVSRDPGGQAPLNETVQNQIRNKLRGQLADREYKRIVRELKTRSVIEVERDAG
jgi:parvulin-like peptidyl-prolyl isomerase